MAWQSKQDPRCAGCKKVKKKNEKSTKLLQGKISNAELHQANGFYLKERLKISYRSTAHR